MELNKEVLAKLMWDHLRDVACSTRRKASCIVMLNEADLKKAADRIVDELKTPKVASNA